MVVDAVVRNLEIIGEAAKNVPVKVQNKLQHIPHGRNSSGSGIGLFMNISGLTSTSSGSS